MTLAELLVGALRVWAWTGGAVAVVFLIWGVDRIDPDARGAYPFRLLVAPGVVMLWPLVLWRWGVLEAGRDRPLARHRPDRGAHRVIAPALLAAIALTLAAGLTVRPDWPAETAPVRLSEAAE